jgi:hypothetical protein
VIPSTEPKMCEARARNAEDRRKNRERYSRLRVPNGMHRAEAVAAWQAAAVLADKAMAGLEDQGLVPVDVLPNSEEALAKGPFMKWRCWHSGRRTNAPRRRP